MARPAIADPSARRRGPGPASMATVRHMAMSLIRGRQSRHSLEVRRKKAGWNNAYLEAVVRQATRALSSDCPGPGMTGLAAGGDWFTLMR
jgi:hypothetical protein